MTHLIINGFKMCFDTSNHGTKKNSGIYMTHSLIRAITIHRDRVTKSIEKKRKRLPLHFGRGGMLCSFLKKLLGSTAVFTLTNLSKLSLKYLTP